MTLSFEGVEGTFGGLVPVCLSLPKLLTILASSHNNGSHLSRNLMMRGFFQAYFQVIWIQIVRTTAQKPPSAPIPMSPAFLINLCCSLLNSSLLPTTQSN